jgi:hypothetical protein
MLLVRNSSEKDILGIIVKFIQQVSGAKHSGYNRMVKATIGF